MAPCLVPRAGANWQVHQRDSASLLLANWLPIPHNATDITLSSILNAIRGVSCLKIRDLYKCVVSNL